jgi:hypothetical protein
MVQVFGSVDPVVSVTRLLLHVKAVDDGAVETKCNMSESFTGHPVPIKLTACPEMPLFEVAAMVAW